LDAPGGGDRRLSAATRQPDAQHGAET